MYKQVDYSKYEKNETGRSRVFSGISSAKSFAVISAYTLERFINEKREENDAAHKNLKNEIKTAGLGNIELQAGYRYEVIDADGCVAAEGVVDECTLIIMGISYDRAIMLGEKYNQHSILFKDENCFKSVYCRDFTDSSGITHYAGEIEMSYSMEMKPVVFTCYSSDGEPGNIPCETELALSRLKHGECFHIDNTIACIAECIGILELQIPSRTDAYAAMKKKDGPTMASWTRIL